MKRKTIYVVDDEERIRNLISTYLKKEGYEVEAFPNGESALRTFSARPADMLVIDIMMPGMDGYSLCREVRKTSDVPIIMVSAKDDEIDKILGLELGSDDYISKPFSPRELIARIKTIFRRVDSILPQKEEVKKSEVKCKDITMLPDERRALRGDVEIDFTAKEYDFLLFLTKNKNKAFTREQLISHIWGYDFIGDSRAVDDIVKRVRKKLAQAGSNLEVTTIWGYGYKVSE